MNLPSAIPQVSTEKLVLRPLTTRDDDTIARLSDEPEVRTATRFIPPRPGEAAASEWIRRVTSTGGDPACYSWAITDVDRGTIKGVVGLTIERFRECGQLDCWIGRPFRSQGIATEACRAVLRTGFNDFGLHRIETRHLMREQPAGRLLERLGFMPEGVRRQAEKWDGRFEDVAHYGLLRSDVAR